MMFLKKIKNKYYHIESSYKYYKNIKLDWFEWLERGGDRAK